MYKLNVHKLIGEGRPTTMPHGDFILTKNNHRFSKYCLVEPGLEIPRSLYTDLTYTYMSETKFRPRHRVWIYL